MTEEPERAAAGRASARGEKDERERDLNFSDGTLGGSRIDQPRQRGSALVPQAWDHATAGFAATSSAESA